MAEFYELHDSTLKGMENSEGSLVLRLKAYLHLQPEELREEEWTGWTQEIELTVVDPIVEDAFRSFPVTIYDGSFKAAKLVAKPQDIVDGEIPASLSSATEIEINIFGQGGDLNEYREMVIRGASLAITFKQEAKFVEKWQPTI